MRSTRIPPATAVLVAVAVVLAVPPAPASAQALDDPFAGGDYTFSTTDFGGEDPFALEATTSAPVEPFTFGATATDDLLDLSGTIEFGTTPAGTADLFAPAPSLSFPWDGGATASPAPAVQAGALQAEMQRWQRDLQTDGVIAHSAAEVFNNHQQELSSRFGLTAQQATEALGGSYSNRVGQRLVGPCLDPSCPNWGLLSGFGPATGPVSNSASGSTTTTAPPTGSGPALQPLPVLQPAPVPVPAATGGGATAGPVPAVQADALQAEMQRWQRDLQSRGVIAHSAAEVFNNHQAELSSRFGLSAQQATEALGGTYSNRVGQRLVGPELLGPAIVGEGIVGEGIVGACLDASCPNYGLLSGFGATTPAGGGQPRPPLPGGGSNPPSGSTTATAPTRSQAAPQPVPVPVPQPVQVPQPQDGAAPPAPATLPQDGNPALAAPAGQQQQGGGSARNPFYGPIDVLTGTVPSYLIKREIQPDVGQVPESAMAARLAPNVARGALTDFVIGSGLSPIDTGDPWTSAIANGCQDAAATQCALVGSRRVLNPEAGSQAATPDQRPLTQRVPDAPKLVNNLAAPLLSTATDQTLRALGQEDNYALNVGAQAVFGAGLPEGVPISLAQGRFVRGAFVYPTVQSVIARTASDALIGLAPASVGQALSEACSDDNPVVNAAAGLACNLGQNPNQQPPVAPPPNTGGAPVTATSTVTTAALQAEMQRWQRDLQADGVIAHSAAEVFNNHQQELSSRFGLSAQQATEALGGSYSNRVGQRITGPAIVGPAIVGPAIVGPKIVGPAIVGEGIVGEGIVGPCLDASCPNWGRINGFASAPSAPSAVTSGGSAPVWNPPAVRAPAGGSRVQPAPAAPAAPSAVRRPSTTPSPHPGPGRSRSSSRTGCSRRARRRGTC